MAQLTVCDMPIRGDICGAPVEEVTEVLLDGKRYQMEICEQHRKPIRDVIERVKPSKVPAQKSRSNGSNNGNGRRRKPPTDAEVRAWAMESGLDVHPTGRVPGAIKEQYELAQMM